MHAHERTGHERTYFDAVDRFDAAGIGLPVGDFAAEHLGHFDRGGGRGRGGGRVVPGLPAEHGKTTADQDQHCRGDGSADGVTVAKELLD